MAMMSAGLVTSQTGVEASSLANPRGLLARSRIGRKKTVFL